MTLPSVVRGMVSREHAPLEQRWWPEPSVVGSIQSLLWSGEKTKPTITTVQSLPFLHSSEDWTLPSPPTHRLLFPLSKELACQSLAQAGGRNTLLPESRGKEDSPCSATRLSSSSLRPGKSHTPGSGWLFVSWLKIKQQTAQSTSSSEQRSGYTIRKQREETDALILDASREGKSWGLGLVKTVLWSWEVVDEETRWRARSSGQGAGLQACVSLRAVCGAQGAPKCGRTSQRKEKGGWTRFPWSLGHLPLSASQISVLPVKYLGSCRLWRLRLWVQVFLEWLHTPALNPRQVILLKPHPLCHCPQPVLNPYFQPPRIHRCLEFLFNHV